MPTRTTSSTSEPQLLRLKAGTGDDDIHADGATVPADSDTLSFGAQAPNRKGHHSEVELFVVAVDADGTAIARASCTFTLHCVHVAERQPEAAPGETWPDVAVTTAPIETQALQTAIRVPWNGGKMFAGLTDITGAPVGATGFQIFAKPVAG